MTDILVLNYNDSATTEAFVRKTANYKIGTLLVVDNGSTDGSYEALKALESGTVKVLHREENGGYGSGNNFGIRYLADHSSSAYILLANPDTMIEEDVLQKLEDFLSCHPDYAIAAPVLCDAKGRRQRYTAFRIPTIWELILSSELVISKLFPLHYYRGITEPAKGAIEVDAVSGSLLMMNKAHMLEKGMYDENLFLYYEELVLGKKLKAAGLKTALLRDTIFLHQHSASVSKAYPQIAARQRLLNHSRMYVLKAYYGASKGMLRIAKLFGAVNVLEVTLWTALRQFLLK